MGRPSHLTPKILADLLSLQLETSQSGTNRKVLRQTITRFSAIQHMIEAVTVAAEPQAGTENALRPCLVDIITRAAEFGASRSPGLLGPRGTNWYQVQLRVMAELCRSELSQDIQALAGYGSGVLDLAKLVQAEAATIGSLAIIPAKILDEKAMDSFIILSDLQPSANGTKPTSLAT